ncbi:MAG: transposase [bacterium]
MPFRTVSLAQGEFYHIYNRGNNKDAIFFERENYCYFLRKFLKYFPPSVANVHSFCLMPNHYHFLLHLTAECDYSSRMQHFGIAYAKAVNKRYLRIGHLFQGRFRAKLIDSDEYFFHLSRYIHLNPLFAKLVSRAEDWEFSSYRAYLMKDWKNPPNSTDSQTCSGLNINTSFILSHFSSVEDYRLFVESYAVDRMNQVQEELWS